MKIAVELLGDALLLPKGCKIVDASPGEPGTLNLVVTGRSLPRDASEVVAIYRKEGGVTRFLRFETAHKAGAELTI